MRQSNKHLTVLSIIGILQGCGGGVAPNSQTLSVLTTVTSPPTSVTLPVATPVTPPVTPSTPTAARGDLLQSPPAQVESLSAAGMASRLSSFGSAGKQVLNATGAPKCGVDVHHVKYKTVGAAGEPATASAALMVPTGTDAACTGSRPVVLYGHGSSIFRDLNMANMRTDATDGFDAAVVAATYAAQGYIVVAPNYVGYDTSDLSYHPHHVADQQSKDMIDGLTAARKALALLPRPVSENGKLFVTGYSEGGYAAMATHRAMQAAGIAVTASAPQSGNYAESVNYELMFGTKGAFDAPTVDDTNLLIRYVMKFTGWQKAYGNLYTTPSEIYPAAYAGAMETLTPITVSLQAFAASGKLPRFLLANDMPQYASLSPQQQANFGPPDQSLIKSSYLVKIINDVAARPCPVTSASAPLDCSPTNTARQAWLKNDLRTWVPKAPMLMCGGNGDPEVRHHNILLTQAYFQAHGVAPGTVTTLDVDTAIAPNDPYATAKSMFQDSKARVLAGGGDPSSEQNYHGYMAFLACNAAASEYFKKF